MAEMIVALIDGDYLAYSDYDKPATRRASYWPSSLYDTPYPVALVRLSNVPSDIVEKLMVQGSSDQYYGDGYEATFAAAPYMDEFIGVVPPSAEMLITERRITEADIEEEDLFDAAVDLAERDAERVQEKVQSAIAKGT